MRTFIERVDDHQQRAKKLTVLEPLSMQLLCLGQELFRTIQSAQTKLNTYNGHKTLNVQRRERKTAKKFEHNSEVRTKPVNK